MSSVDTKVCCYFSACFFVATPRSFIYFAFASMMTCSLPFLPYFLSYPLQFFCCCHTTPSACCCFESRLYLEASKFPRSSASLESRGQNMRDAYAIVSSFGSSQIHKPLHFLRNFLHPFKYLVSALFEEFENPNFF